MAGLERIVVGYRQGSRKIYRLHEDYGIRAVKVRPCMAGCGYPVYFCSGGIDAVVERDAEVVCEECKTLYYPDLIREL